MCHLQNLRARCRGETKEQVMHVMQLKGVPSGFKKTMCAMTPTLPPSMILDRQPHVIYYDSDGIEI